MFTVEHPFRNLLSQLVSATFENRKVQSDLSYPVLFITNHQGRFCSFLGHYLTLFFCLKREKDVSRKDRATQWTTLVSQQPEA